MIESEQKVYEKKISELEDKLSNAVNYFRLISSPKVTFSRNQLEMTKEALFFCMETADKALEEFDIPPF